MATRAFAMDRPLTWHLPTTDNTDDESGVDWESVSVVAVDNPPYEQAFATDRFYKIPTTATKPLDQTYGEDTVMRKPASELRQAAWSLNNRPFTLGHPDNRLVDSIDLIHGFVRDATVTDDGELTCHVYVPVNDDTATEYVATNDGVSVGFWYDADTVIDDESVDAYQRNILFDHLAGVSEGRCSHADGCGLAADVANLTAVSATDRQCSDGACQCGLHVGADADTDTQSQQSSIATDVDAAGANTDATNTGTDVTNTVDDATEGDVQADVDNIVVAIPMGDAKYTSGEYVSWEYSGGTSYGRVSEKFTDEGTVTRTYDGTEVTREVTEDEPAYELRVWRDEDEEYRGGALKSESEVSSWDAPEMARDSAQDVAVTIDKDVEDVDLSVPDSAQSAAQAFLDANEIGLVPDECGTGEGTISAEMIANNEVTPDRLENDITPYLVSHDDDVSTDTHPTDWPMPDPSEYDTDGDGESMPETPWQDCGDAQFASWGWTSLVDWAKRKADELKRARDEEPIYDSRKRDSQLTIRKQIHADTAETSDSPMPQFTIDVDDESVDTFDDVPLDKLAQAHDGVADALDRADESESRVEELETQLDAARNTADDLRNTIDALDRGEQRRKADLVDEITTLTETWDEAELLEQDRETLEERKELAEDLAADVSGSVEGDSGGAGASDGDDDDDADSSSYDGPVYLGTKL